MGSVVAIDEFSSRRVFTLDDSSGRCIEAWVISQSHTAYRPNPELQQASAGASVAVKAGTGRILCNPISPQAYDEIDIGDVLDVKGSLCSFKGETQIKIEKFAFVKSTAHEIMLWQKRSHFQRHVLDRPWVLESRVIRRCRKEAEASDWRSERKTKRHQMGRKTASEKKNSTRSSTARVSESAQPRQGDNESKPPKVAARLKELIRDGSVKGKYGALGL